MCEHNGVFKDLLMISVCKNASDDDDDDDDDDHDDHDDYYYESYSWQVSIKSPHQDDEYIPQVIKSDI